MQGKAIATRWLLVPACMWLGLAMTPVGADAQIVSCNFEVPTNLGRFFSEGTAHLVGRPGSGTNIAIFELINPNSAEMDVNHLGYAPPPGCDYNALFIPASLRKNLVNVSNPALAIPAANVIVTNLPHSLLSGTTATVSLYVNVPPGTPAGRYLGEFQIRDQQRGVTSGPNNELLGAARVAVDVTVLPEEGIGLVSADSAVQLDSLLVRARAGQRVQSVFRVQNAGNAPLTSVHVAVSDLRSESAVGIIIPAQAISFSPDQFPSLAVGDTTRMTITIQVPRGILGGRYRGSLIVQGEGAPGVTIPLVVIVSASRGIVFENNPVRNINGVGRIAFNGDPGTQYQLAIFDMNGLLVYTTTGTIYPGAVATGAAAGTTGPGADFAAAVTWPLTNGKGDAVASGMYLVVVNSIVNGQRQLAKDKLMVIR